MSGNMITRGPRDGITSGSCVSSLAFYPNGVPDGTPSDAFGAYGFNSHDNTFEYNVLDTLTALGDDVGALSLLGSG